MGIGQAVDLMRQGYVAWRRSEPGTQYRIVATEVGEKWIDETGEEIWSLDVDDVGAEDWEVALS